MKAFIAVLLVAAVSGQFATSGVEKSIVDYLRNRNVYPYTVGSDRSAVYPTTSYGKYIQQAFAGLVGNNNYDFSTTGYFPYGQQYNVPSDVYTPTSYYTLSQLYASPIFQQYLDLPFFRLYVTYPAFQRYLASGYFQQYYTQPIFQQFFREPALFYKYIYPVVVAQFQTVGTTFEQVLPVPEVYQKFVPEYVYNYVNNYVNRGVDSTIFGRRSFLPTPYSAQYKPEYFARDSYYPQSQYVNKQFGYNWEKPTMTGYNWEKPTMTGYNWEKPTMTGYNWEKPTMTGYNTYPYNYNFEGMNVNDIETIRKVIFPQTFEKSATYPRNWYNGNNFYNNFNAKKNGWENKFVPFTAQENTPTYAPQYAFDKIFKDLVEGKVNINEFKNTQVAQDTFKTVVDPITGEIKIVEEKVVKPVDNTVESELTKDALLRKVILKKEVFNKV